MPLDGPNTCATAMEAQVFHGKGLWTCGGKTEASESITCGPILGESALIGRNRP